MRKIPINIVFRLVGFTIWQATISLVWCGIINFQIEADVMVCIIIPRCASFVFVILSTLFIRKPWAYRVNSFLFLLPEFIIGFLLTVVACFMAGPFGIIAPVIIAGIVSVIYRILFTEKIRAYFGFKPKENDYQ